MNTRPNSKKSSEPDEEGWYSPPEDWAAEPAASAEPVEQLESTDSTDSPDSVNALDAVDSVAERLEEIARTLRDQGSAGLLVSHTHNPLHLLIAGYALGYAAAVDEISARRKH